MKKTSFASPLVVVSLAVPFLILVAIPISCLSKKGKLTSDLAREKLSQALDCPVVLLLPEGKITDHLQLDMPMPSLKAAQASSEVLKGLERDSKIIKLLKSMADEGYISFFYSSPRIIFDPKARVQPLRVVYEIELTLTERGKEFQINSPAQDSPFSLSLKYFLLSPLHEKVFREEFGGEFTVCRLKLCEKVVSKITRIRKTGKRSVSVDFEWKFDRFTTLGEFIGRDFEWTFHDGFFAVMAFREGSWSRMVDLLDGKISTRDSARFVLEGEDWRIEQGKNP